MVQGTVQAHEQADLKSQVSAPLTSIYKNVGDTVSRGEAIAELQNADIKAQLESVKASLVLAQSQYASSRQSSIDKVRDAYLNADTAVHSQIDQLVISSNVGNLPPVYVYSLDSSLSNKVRLERIDLTTTFKNWQALIDPLTATSSDESIHSAIVVSQQNLTIISSLLNDVAMIFNDATTVSPPQNLPVLNGYQTIISSARASVNAAKDSLTAAAAALSDSQVPGGSAAQASVSVARAAVDNLQAQLAKTIIRSPLDGKVSALPLKVGEFASPGQLIATVVGSGGLQIKAFASGEDFMRIQPGAPAIIQGSVKGIVSNVAPSVNASNRKAEIDIDVTDHDSSSLVIGDNVQASIMTGDYSAPNNSSQSSGKSSQGFIYLLPIQDVKIVPGDAYVFTIGSDSKVVKNEVILGSVKGDFIEIQKGLSDDMNIVSPVYELEEGQSVIAQ